jgi:gliding motility-associated-like protein
MYIENIEAYPTSDLKVFNEYGQQVFEAKPYLNNWKGTYNNARLPDGTYYYVLSFSDKPKVFKGTVTLMSQ